MAGTNTFDQWALVEVMGHQRIAGRVTEAEIGGCKFVRVDVPETQTGQALTKYLGPSAIYAITPITEETARAFAAQCDPEPVNVWSARGLVENYDERQKQKQLAANGVLVTVDTYESVDEDDDDENDSERPF